MGCAGYCEPMHAAIVSSAVRHHVRAELSLSSCSAHGTCERFFDPVFCDQVANALWAERRHRHGRYAVREPPVGGGSAKKAHGAYG